MSPDLDGLSPTECAAGCGVDGCLISGKAYCAHPCKAGLMFDDRTDPAAQKRYSDARRALGLPVQKESV